MPEIILKNITKRFGGSFTAVDNLSLTIEDGDFITLLGPSGCGKTTTLRQIAGLETPTCGEIYIDGKLMFSSTQQIDVSPSKRGVGFLFQNYALWPHMTVYQNIAFGLENMKWDKNAVARRVKELLVLLKIEEFPDRYPAELSGGQQQRVAIARTLANNPRVLLMDEPLSNLDAKLRMEMRTELKRLHHETGATFIYVTHDQLEAMTLATKICLLDKGLLQQYAPPLEVYSKPANTFVADFVGNPTINLIPFAVEGVDVSGLKLENVDFSFSFVPSRPLCDFTSKKVVVGIRPEDIVANDVEGLPVTVGSSLPSGMETILKLDVSPSLSLNSVVFGSLDYKIGSKLKAKFPGSKFILFDEKGCFVTTGSINAEQK
ncbi:MAG: ABC transporter ATP-binding protein [Sphaerochaetaceae bacterium]